MDKIKYHIRKNKKRQAVKETLIDVAIALVIALVLTPIFIFLIAGVL